MSAYALGWKLICRVPESWAALGVPVSPPTSPGAGRGRGCRGWRPTCAGCIGPDGDRKADCATLSRAGDALLRPVLAEVFRLPVIAASGSWPGMRFQRPNRRRCSPTWRRPGRDRRAAAHGQLGCRPAPGSSPAGPGSSPPSPSGSSPSRCTSGSSRSGRAWAWRCCPPPAAAAGSACWPSGCAAGGLVCLLADRDVTGGGIEVEFFGEKARMMGGPAALAVQTGAALMPATLWFEGEDWGAHIYDGDPGARPRAPGGRRSPR